jgi:hypothetical protein
MRDNHGTQMMRIPIRFHIGLGRLDWEITHETGIPVFVGFEGNLALPHIKVPDGWELVREYLAVNADDEKSVLEFLTSYGWLNLPQASVGKGLFPLLRIGNRRVSEWFSLEEFASVQDYIRRMVSRGNPTLPTPWQPNVVQLYRMFFREVRSGPQAEVPIEGVYPSILATVQFKLVQGAKFRTCARKDCRLPFEVTSHHKRRFCTQYCAHITSLRQRRKLERKMR